VRDTHKSSDFIAFLQRLDARYPAGTPIRLLLDNHSAHISRETQAYLQKRLISSPFMRTEFRAVGPASSRNPVTLEGRRAGGVKQGKFEAWSGKVEQVDGASRSQYPFPRRPSSLARLE
jgi:hypothetical protein